MYNDVAVHRKERKRHDRRTYQRGSLEHEEPNGFHIHPAVPYTSNVHTYTHKMRGNLLWLQPHYQNNVSDLPLCPTLTPSIREMFGFFFFTGPRWRVGLISIIP
ncbi:hypothetical protein XENORESO_014694 [Xenotaenia resolanae]|uniref:Uncharacterized protein n=1 Tax=Xenotaenia resolanae TaxID=208358 RepID=A0ABV0W409_9TELE